MKMPDWPLNIRYRPGTHDEAEVKNVFIGNCYRLPERFEPTDIVLDCGAQIGTFTMACLERGAKNVWSYEAAKENFAWLEKNIRGNEARWPDANIQLYQWIVWGSHEQVQHKRFLYAGDVYNACSRVVLDEEKVDGTYLVQTITFDEAVLMAIGHTPGHYHVEPRRIRFCKLDVEGAECVILPTSKMLDLIDEIALEYHGDIAEPIKKLLCQRGFNVEINPAYDPKYPNVVQGLMFARRPQDKPTVIETLNEESSEGPKWPREIVPNALTAKVTHGS